MKDNKGQVKDTTKDLLSKIEKLKKDYVGEMNDSKSEGQKKKKKMKDIKRDIARLKTKLNQNLYEEASNE
jgi:ribosomal protein L29